MMTAMIRKNKDTCRLCGECEELIHQPLVQPYYPTHDNVFEAPRVSALLHLVEELNNFKQVSFMNINTCKDFEPELFFSTFIFLSQNIRHTVLRDGRIVLSQSRNETPGSMLLSSVL